MEPAELSENSGSGRHHWVFFGDKVPREEIVYITQIIIILTIIIFSLHQIAIGSEDKEFFRNMLCFSFGAVVPNPQMKHKKKT